jgi:dihydropyrimidine dehydrogenase (NAD+) subunit PreA
VADLSTDLAGIRSPNPFWLASAPPTNSGYQVMRAFAAGWGGAVWKTLGDPIVNVSSRFAGLDAGPRKLIGLNNIELITDRALEVNLAEIVECKAAYPDRAIVASLMMEMDRGRWHDLVRTVQAAGVDGFELNFGCPHGMSERGMGAAVGQDPELVERCTRWVVEVSTVPVIVKLTPNITDIRVTARAAKRGGAHAISLINTINSLIGVDLDTWNPIPHVDGLGAHGGYCGPAVKPIALNMVADCARDALVRLPISGIGGVGSWRDAVEFLLMGSTNVQVCTAVMHHGFRIVEDMLDGLNNYLDARGIGSVRELVGKSVPKFVDWNDLNLDYKVVASIDPATCIRCNKCYIACEDAAHQCIDRVLQPDGGLAPVVDQEHCVGCNLCQMVCPVDECITMLRVDDGAHVATWRERMDAALVAPGGTSSER